MSIRRSVPIGRRPCEQRTCQDGEESGRVWRRSRVWVCCGCNRGPRRWCVCTRMGLGVFVRVCFGEVWRFQAFDSRFCLRAFLGGSVCLFGACGSGWAFVGRRASSARARVVSSVSFCVMLPLALVNGVLVCVFNSVEMLLRFEVRMRD
jgi:hypothetical protein